MSAALVIAATSCGKKSTPEATIIDLSTSTAPLRNDFDAHADEPRFVTLIAPT